jgi:uncharacterized protein
VSRFLLDVNVLVALSWPEHEFHETVQDWFGRNARNGWATCPLTQAGFVRIVSNPAFSPRAVSPTEALQALALTVRHPAHEFWPDHITVVDALARFEGRLVGHQQVTDAYLLALAIEKKGKLATLDRSIVDLVDKRESGRGGVEVIHARC